MWVLRTWSKPFLERKLISTSRFPISPTVLIEFNSLEGITFYIKSIIPPPCCVLSNMYGGVCPPGKNWLEGKDAFSFISEINKTSILIAIISACVKTSLFGFLSQISCNIFEVFKGIRLIWAFIIFDF